MRLPTPIVRVDPAGAHTEVGQLGSALNRMLDRIAGALSARHASETRVRQFVADASHELRTPLAAIRGYTELAQRKRDELPDDVAHAMSRVESETAAHDAARRGHAAAGPPGRRAGRWNARAVDLSRLVVDTVSDAHVAGPDHDWSLDLPDEPVIVIGDEARLHQVLANLLANARTHTPPGRRSRRRWRVDWRRCGADGGRRRPGHPETICSRRSSSGSPAATRRARGAAAAPGSAWRSSRPWSRRTTAPSMCDSAPGSTEFVVTLPDGSQPTHSANQSDA